MEREYRTPTEKAFLKAGKRISSSQMSGEGLSEREPFHGKSSTEELDDPAKENINSRT